jgi:hypothetical protein
MSNAKFGKHPKAQTELSGNSRKKVVAAREQSLASPIEHTGNA